MKYILLTLLLTGFLSCKKTVENPENPIVAEVFGKQLLEDELLQMLPTPLNATDSTARANAYIEKWIREKLWEEEAEKNVPSDLNINQLVRDYRSSLLRLQFEKKILKESLDTTISNAEILTNYDAVKLQYLLKEPIVRCWLAKVPEEVENQKRFYQLWKNSEKSEVNSFLAANANYSFMEDSIWVSVSDLHAIVPQNILGNSSFSKKKSFQIVNNGQVYYIKINEYVDKNEIPPLAYIGDKIKRVILQKRKEEVLAAYSEKLYQNNIRANTIKVYSNASS